MIIFQQKVIHQPSSHVLHLDLFSRCWSGVVILSGWMWCCSNQSIHHHLLSLGWTPEWDAVSAESSSWNKHHNTHTALKEIKTEISFMIESYLNIKPSFIIRLCFKIKTHSNQEETHRREMKGKKCTFILDRSSNKAKQFHCTF